jgi:hypothetical protein
MAGHPLTNANIIELLGIEALPLEKRVEIVEETTELVQSRVLERALRAAQGESRAALDAAAESGDEIAMAEALEKSGVDVLAITEEEIERVKHELLALKQETDQEI